MVESLQPGTRFLATDNGIYVRLFTVKEHDVTRGVIISRERTREFSHESILLVETDGWWHPFDPLPYVPKFNVNDVVVVPRNDDDDMKRRGYVIDVEGNNNDNILVRVYESGEQLSARWYDVGKIVIKPSELMRGDRVRVKSEGYKKNVQTIIDVEDDPNVGRRYWCVANDASGSRCTWYSASEIVPWALG